MDGLDELKLEIRFAIEDHATPAATHWRDESTAALRDDLLAWNVDPDVYEVAAAFLAGAHFLRTTALTAHAHGLPVATWMDEAVIAAGERLEAVEWLASHGQAR